MPYLFQGLCPICSGDFVPALDAHIVTCNRCGLLISESQLERLQRTPKQEAEMRMCKWQVSDGKCSKHGTYICAGCDLGCDDYEPKPREAWPCPDGNRVIYPRWKANLGMPVFNLMGAHIGSLNSKLSKEDKSMNSSYKCYACGDSFHHEEVWDFNTCALRWGRKGQDKQEEFAVSEAPICVGCYKKMQEALKEFNLPWYHWANDDDD